MSIDEIETHPECRARTDALLDENLHDVRVRTDVQFARLMILQWIGGIVAAVLLTPRTWSGAQSTIHPHVLAATLLGMLFTIGPVWCVRAFPGATVTRHAIAAGQMLTSALLIHVSGGRIETHFHVFGSLAFLSFYRDARVIITATAVTAVDHALRGTFFPMSVFGIIESSPWRWIEHAAWVIFTDFFLIVNIRTSVADMRRAAVRRVHLEVTKASVEEVVRERTAELVVARDEALEATRLKSQFLANMSHEVRTPMNGVLGMTQLLLGTKLDATQRDFATTLQSSAESMLVVLNDILDFSKIDADQLELERATFDVTEVVEDSVRLMTATAHARGLELLCSTPGDVPAQVTGDPFRLKQVLLNLLGNAVKFTEAGRVAIDVSVERGDDDVAWFTFAVSDTGIGIGADKLATIFDAFSQADTSTTREFGGTGLGLAICAQLSELMGGGIVAESRLGEGTTFRLRLPFVMADASSPEEVGFDGLAFLVVDDDEASRTLLSDQARSWGADVTTVSGTQPALELLARRPLGERAFDALVIDADMPGADGLALLEALRHDPAHAGRPVVFLPRFGDRDAIDVARTLGAEGIVTKPVFRGRLHAALASAVGRAGELRPAAPEPSVADEAPAPDASPLASADEPLLLVAEDNPVNRKLIKHVLDKLGYRADLVENGRLAVEAVAKKPYAAVLMDCQMPVMDGYEAASAIRFDAGLSVPILALTAHAMSGDREKALRAGMDDYLTKPVDIEVLRETLARWAPRAPDPADAPA